MAQAVLDQRVRTEPSPNKDPIRQLLDRRVPWAVQGELYTLQSLGASAAPCQGWKIHISASPGSALEVLSTSLDVLLTEGARFKVVSSMSILLAINAGEFGVSQIGKFITVYPSDEGQAVRLAVQLDQATRGRRGPRVPSDRPLRPGSLVHYRYGAMHLRPEGKVVDEDIAGRYDLVDPMGRWFSDVRHSYYVAPHGVVDPFELAGAYTPGKQRERLLDGRYLVIDALSQSPRGGVFRAIDLGATPARRCLLKEFWHDVGAGEDGRDARDWAVNEERILTRHVADSSLPRFLGSFEIDGDRYNAIEYVVGDPLDRVLSEDNAAMVGVAPSTVTRIGLATADALAHLHSMDVIFRDLKPANVIMTPDGGYRLIDFGIAHDHRLDNGRAFGAGTPHFCSPEQFAGVAPSPTDDVFAWGAVLHYLACGDASLADMAADPALARPVRRLPVCEVNANFPRSVAAVIDRAVAWQPKDRFATMLEARSALARAEWGRSAGRADSPASRRGRKATRAVMMATPTQLSSQDALRRAREVGDALCAAAVEHAGGLCWPSQDGPGDRMERSPDLYSGAAGIGLFLAELAHETGDQRYAETARGAGRWLAGPAWGMGRAQHGLYGGEPGVASFFLRLAELLDEPHYVTATDLRMRRLRGAPFVTTDLLHGAAGTVVCLLRLARVTGEAVYLDDARVAGSHLVRSALPAPASRPGCYWNVASADFGGPSAPYLGLLHGAAGIGLALAELAVATQDEQYLDVARGAADLLLGQARQADVGFAAIRSSRPERLAWPRRLGDHTSGLQAHCHGAGGIAQFLVRLNQMAPDQRYRETAQGAARTVADQRSRELHSCLCHGLSGTGHIMIDCHQAFTDPQWLVLARECGGYLTRFHDEAHPGSYARTVNGAASPDLMLGSAGVGSFLLRLASPDSIREPILR